MIKAVFKNSQVVVNCEGEHKSRYYMFFKRNYIMFNKDLGGYTMTPSTFIAIRDELETEETIEISKQDEDTIESRQWGEPSTVFKRRALSPTALVRPPIGEFQLKDIRTMIQQNHIINGNDTGLGKTYETITAINQLFIDQAINKVFVVTVAETLYNWKREFLEFGYNVQESDILIITKDNRELLEQWSDKKIIITAYNTFNLISDYYYKKTKKVQSVPNYRKPVFNFTEWGKVVAVLDEGHKIKNRTSLTSKRLMLYKNQFEFKYILTGTPYANYLSDVWNLCNFLDDGILGSSFSNFDKYTYSITGRFNNVREPKEQNIKKVTERLSKWIFRRFKKDELPDLPSLDIKKIYVEPNREILEIYQTIVKEQLSLVKDKAGYFAPKEVFNKFPYMLLTCSDPSCIKGDFMSDLQNRLDAWKFKKNPKLAMCDTLVDEHSKEKIIIWSTHPTTIDQLYEHYAKKYGEEAVVSFHGQSKLNGMTKEQAKDTIVNRIEKDSNLKIAILSPLVLGTGVSFVKSTVAISWDRSFSEIIWLQSLGRNHRVVSTRDVVHYVLLLDKTLEILQDSVLDKRTDLNRYLMDESVPMNDWIKMLNGQVK